MLVMVTSLLAGYPSGSRVQPPAARLRHRLARCSPAAEHHFHCPGVGPAWQFDRVPCGLVLVTVCSRNQVEKERSTRRCRVP
ncbi:hypothetical protein SUDANB105_08159 (plasmid) [Streptomyces sp. enrichment culture]